MTDRVSPRVVRNRRLAFLAANLLTYLGMLAMLVHAMPWTKLTAILVVACAIFLPWSVLGFWNAVISLGLLFRRPPPVVGTGPLPRTAIIMTIRNEDPDRAVARLRVIQRSLDATGQGAHFGYFVLSDTSRPDIAAAEEVAMGAWRAGDVVPGRLHYRRRALNIGFKAGNVMDFCQTWADDFPLMVTLDADSLMSGAAILHLVRIMGANPAFGIVQGLVAGLQSASPFARIFQFGMRHGMRSYTVGQAWWTADCGPFWGHNAIIRTAPFRDHCGLPVLPGRPPFGGHILSHDQVEATLMRRAGYEVRLQPVAGGSWEENPPTVLDYIRRDLRWCQGNLQYLRLLGTPGLRPVSRFQLCWAILMFVSIPAWTVAVTLLPLAVWQSGTVRVPWLIALYWLYLLMYFSPKLVGYVHTGVSRRRRGRYGGLARFIAGVGCEIVFSLIQSSITSLHTTGFIAAMLFGRSASWSGQVRDSRVVSWREAGRALWPQTVFGIALHAALLAMGPAILPWALPYTAGYLLAVPFAVVTASPAVGAWCVRHGLCAVPEDYDPPPELAALP